MADDIESTIEEALARVKADGVEVQAHPLPERIAAARYLDSGAAAREAGSLETPSPQDTNTPWGGREIIKWIIYNPLQLIEWYV